MVGLLIMGATYRKRPQFLWTLVETASQPIGCNRAIGLFGLDQHGFARIANPKNHELGGIIRTYVLARHHHARHLQCGYGSSKARMKTEFLANKSYQLHTSLNAVMGISDFAARARSTCRPNRARNDTVTVCRHRPTPISADPLLRLWRHA